MAQSFSYDLDGNTLSDGIWDYQWDAENRLVRLETAVAARSAGFAHRILNFTYDYLGRRVQKQVMDGVTSTELTSQRFIYNGWDVIAEYSVAAGTTLDKLQRTYAWGIDLASSLTKAGGVGALLQFANTPTGQTYLPTYDGNGNVASLVNPGTGALAASYEYTPFGEMLRCEGAYAKSNPFRFSTKWQDDETGLINYGCRYYSPSQGRFLGRDPIEESGGLNLYGFCGNNAINRWDYLGMYDHYAEPDQWTEHIDDIDLMARMLQGTPLVWARTFEDGRWSAIYREASGSRYSVFGDANGAVRMKATHYNNSDGGMDDFGGIEDAEAAREALIDDDNYFYNQEGDYWNSNWEDASNSAAAAVASSGSGGSVLGGIVSGALDLVGKVWNLPNTAVGLVFGGVGYVAGLIQGTNPGISIGNNAIQFTNVPTWLMPSAITLGNTITYGGQPSDPAYSPGLDAATGGRVIYNGTTGEHERQHTYQGQLLGPLYLPSNMLGMAAGMIFNGDHHGPANWNERGPQSTTPTPWNFGPYP